jgi:transcriptional regulator with XRE-family HTH domain
MDNKNVFAKNLKRYMDLHGKSRKEVSEAIGVSYYTYTDWVNGKKYPRMDKVEKLANYFGILKSDLIEEKTQEHRDMQKKNDAIKDIILELRKDEVFLSIVQSIYEMDSEKRSSLLTFLK